MSIHWERLVRNPITGRCAWALRHIPTGVYGDPYDWSIVVVRPHWGSRTAILMLIEGMTLSKRRKLQAALRSKGFRRAKALQPGGWATWSVKGRRFRERRRPFQVLPRRP